MPCKVVDPGGNIICTYRGYYFVRRRHRNGRFYGEDDWVGITRDLYILFKEAGSKVLDIVPVAVINYVNHKYGEE